MRWCGFCCFLFYLSNVSSNVIGGIMELFVMSIEHFHDFVDLEDIVNGVMVEIADNKCFHYAVTKYAFVIDQLNKSVCFGAAE